MRDNIQSQGRTKKQKQTNTLFKRMYVWPYPPWRVQSAFRLVENEKMGLVQNVQPAFLRVENQNNSCPLLDRQCMRKCKIVFFDS